LRRELEASSPTGSGKEGEWDAAAELAEVEKLAEMGIVLKPREESSGRKGKGKATPPSGHVIFVEGREECKCPCST
jgi:U3 small nucleolar RNA-associated protein 11